VRSSALIEDRAGANFAGQFESFLGLADEAEFLTAVRACWAALWTTNARRYFENHGLGPAATAMAVLIQPLVAARAAAGLERDRGRPDAHQRHLGARLHDRAGEVVPDRIVLSRQGFLRKIEAGRKAHRETCMHGVGTMPQACRTRWSARRARRRAGGDARAPHAQGRKRLGMPVEIEWALDEGGFKLLQARPLHVEPAHVPDEIWLQHPGLNGHPPASAGEPAVR